MKNSLLSIFAIFTSVVIISAFLSKQTPTNLYRADKESITKTGVCPPFFLYDENGGLINPAKGLNADKPYSPRQTCGKCHDYEKITRGFHFQQGKDETPNDTLKSRYQWVTHPGNYGGTWCSPAPLYRYLAPKNNKSAKEIDMTSFDFVTATCGACHPGGGPLEFDRNGHRYDTWMADTSHHLKVLGENNFDGDYFKANWSQTGVIEADCQLCHLPEYNYKERNKQLEKWNFRWAATQGSGIATVEGSIKDSIPVVVNYDLGKFDKDGKVSLHLVREVRSETCLNCHAKPDWKKKGTSYTARRDVHIKAGLKCVDCHTAGKMASDPRIRGKEMHQFGKGDDPAGLVRNDLDNTVRDCEDCHLNGYLNAPIAKHSWLPPLHLEELSCEACHIDERPVKAALVQVSDVYNPGTKISPPGKYIWTFYDQHMNYWNHYGELEMFTAQDQPTDPFVPTLAKYKGKIYPVNIVHSAWPGIFTEGKPGLHQPKMKDIYEMWTLHRKDPAKYALLKQIRDDNGDSIPEVNSAQEIDALISSVTEHLKFKGYDLTGKKIVWVSDDRMYFNGKDFRKLDKENYEATPYASVHKLSHNVLPARAALGINGCTDCHRLGSGFFFGSVLKYPFDGQGKPVTEPQYKKLEISAFSAYLGAIRESIIKPVLYFAIGAFLLMAIMSVFFTYLWTQTKIDPLKQRIIFIVTHVMILIAGVILFFSTELTGYLLPSRMLLDSNHFLISVAVFLTGIVFYFNHQYSKVKPLKLSLLSMMLLLCFISGLLMLVHIESIEFIGHLAYSMFDISLVCIIIICLTFLTKDRFNEASQN